MRAGNLRHIVNIEIPVTSTGTDEHGQPVVTWSSTIANSYQRVPVEIETLSGRELEKARILVNDCNTQVRSRYLPNITVKHRIRFGSRLMNIGHINNVEQRNRELIFTCTEEVN